MTAPFRSLLFVPGARPDRFAKALRSGADGVCIDLEDSVPPASKAVARAACMAFLAAHSPGPDCALGLRMNALRSADGVRDLAALADAAMGLQFLMIPKATEAAELDIIAAILPGIPLFPLVESAAGLAQARGIARARGVAGLVFGAVDLAAESGATMEWESLLFARATLANARAEAGIELLDVPSLEVHDDEALAASTARSRAMGFTGRACIHPAQVGVVNGVFTPGADEAAQALRIIEAYDRAQGGVALLDGKLVERPVMLIARNILRRAGLSGGAARHEAA